MVTDNTGENNISNTDWFNITQRVRRYNRQLVGRLMELEKALEEMQQKYESAQDKSQEQELIASQEQINDLVQKLQQSNEIIQKQKLSIQSLSEELKISREQVAKLERDCALLQGNYNQKNHQLVKLQGQIQELNARLARQQRYNLQLKAALENASVNVPPPETLASAQPIKPWSGETPELVPETSQTNSNPSELVKIEPKKDPFPERIIPKNNEVDVQEQVDIEQEKSIKKQYSVELPSFLKSNPS